MYMQIRPPSPPNLALKAQGAASPIDPAQPSPGSAAANNVSERVKLFICEIPFSYTEAEVRGLLRRCASALAICSQHRLTRFQRIQTQGSTASDVLRSGVLMLNFGLGS